MGRLTAAGVPIVAVDRALPDAPTVAVDHHAGGRMMARHLLDLGHARIAVLGAMKELGETSDTYHAGLAAPVIAAGVAAARVGADGSVDAAGSIAASAGAVAAVSSAA